MEGGKGGQERKPHDAVRNDETGKHMLGFGTLARKVFGTPNDRKVKSVRSLVAKINALEPEFAALTDEEIKARTEALAVRAMGGESLDALLPEAFANCREGARRALGLRALSSAYPVQP